MKKNVIRSITPNGWVYEQVCLAEIIKLVVTLMANLLIYLVINMCLLMMELVDKEATGRSSSRSVGSNPAQQTLFITCRVYEM